MTQDISIEEYNEQYAHQDVQLIDVREVDEFEEIRIAKAINIPLSEFQFRMDEISEDSPVVLVCRSGSRSAMAGDMLSANGYGEVYNLMEGMVGWMRRGLDTAEG